MEYYRETQKIDQWWIRLLLGFVTIIVLSAITISIYQKLKENNLGDDYGLLTSILVGIFALGILLLVNGLLLSMKLEIIITNRQFQYKYWPMVPNWNNVDKSDIESWEVGKYNPMLVGYGYRLQGINGRAYTAKGSACLRLKLKDGKKKLMGTQNPSEIKLAMEKLMASKEEE